MDEERGGRRGNEGNDPFDGLRLDEDFVRRATLEEASAYTRQHLPRVRDEHGRLQKERVAQLRRYKRGLWRARLARMLKGGLGLALVAALLWAAWISRGPGRGVGRAWDRHDAKTWTVSSNEVPPPPADEQARPLGAPAEPPTTDAPYQFLQRQPGGSDPVAYDPCQPVHVVVNTRTAPAQADALLDSALAQVGRATGLKLVRDGFTDEAPGDERPAYQPVRYPRRWAPVLVAWSDPAESPRLEGNVAGFGGSTSYRDTSRGRSVYVTGGVTLDGPQLARILDGRKGFARARRVLLHELGHLVGLDHVDDAAQLMDEVGSPEVSEYADGDLAGLARLGRGDCIPGI